MVDSVLWASGQRALTVHCGRATGLGLCATWVAAAGFQWYAGEHGIALLWVTRTVCDPVVMFLGGSL